MMGVPDALVVDFGGVLTTDLWASIRGCARREGLAENSLLDLLRDDAEIHRLYVGMERGEVSQTDFEARLAEAAGISADGLLARMCADLRPDEAMLDALTTLRTRGVRIGVLSNSWGTGYFSPYEGYQLDHRADAVVFSDQVRLRKPEPEIFELILGLLDVDAPATVFIDDIAANLPPAQAMGMSVIHHTDTPTTLNELDTMFAGLLAPTANR